MLCFSYGFKDIKDKPYFLEEKNAVSVLRLEQLEKTVTDACNLYDTTYETDTKELYVLEMKRPVETF